MEPARDGRLVVVAVGGGALRAPTAARAPGVGPERLEPALAPVVELAAAGFRLVVMLPAGPLLDAGVLAPDSRAAAAQGVAGYAAQQAFGRLCRARGLDVPAVAVLTRVAVDPADPAFQAPAVRVGPVYPTARMRPLERRKGWRFVRAGRGWRRVLPAPRPLAVLEAEAIRRLTLAGTVVLAGGGGGVPVVAAADGYRGVEAVVEPDLTAAVLATAVGAERLLFLTGVPQAVVRFGTRQEIAIERLTVAEARTLLGAAEFPPGSMGPKVEGGVRFVEAGGREAVITAPDHVRAALAGEAGTRVVAG